MFQVSATNHEQAVRGSLDVLKVLLEIISHIDRMFESLA
jgi:hypothetical protein